jgi:hypothetical protein
MSNALMDVLSNTAALFLLWLLADAGLHKLRPANRDYYASVLAGYGVPAGARLAAPLGGVELLAAVLITLPSSRLFGAGLAVLLLLAYAIGVGVQLHRGRAGADCGCAGPGGRLSISLELLLRNLVLVLVAIAVCLVPVGGVDLAGWLLAVPAAAALILVNLSAEQLLGNLPKLRAIRR